MSLEEKNHIDELSDKILHNMLGICSECKNTDVMEKVLSLNVAGAVAILRGLKGDEFIKDFLTSAIKDTANRISVEKAILN